MMSPKEVDLSAFDVKAIMTNYSSAAKGKTRPMAIDGK